MPLHWGRLSPPACLLSAWPGKCSGRPLAKLCSCSSRPAPAVHPTPLLLLSAVRKASVTVGGNLPYKVPTPPSHTKQRLRSRPCSSDQGRVEQGFSPCIPGAWSHREMKIIFQSSMSLISGLVSHTDQLRQLCDPKKRLSL